MYMEELGNLDKNTSIFIRTSTDICVSVIP
jgi:hypothetical protein